jgi:DNA-binding winged helix-turn-helix (wHTH) protein
VSNHAVIERSEQVVNLRAELDRQKRIVEKAQALVYAWDHAPIDTLEVSKAVRELRKALKP